MEKANEYAVESLKQIITLAGVVLALTITFLKDVLGESRNEAILRGLVPVGWVCLIVSIVLAWLAIVEAADALGDSGDQGVTPYAFKAKRTGQPQKLYVLLFILSLFLPFIPTLEKNNTRKLAASAQHYFILGLILLGLFATVNLNTAFRKAPPGPPGPITSGPVQPINIDRPVPSPSPPIIQNDPKDTSPKKRRCRTRKRFRRGR